MSAVVRRLAIPDFEPLERSCRRLWDIAIGDGGPGSYMVGGAFHYTETLSYLVFSCNGTSATVGRSVWYLMEPGLPPRLCGWLILPMPATLGKRHLDNPASPPPHGVRTQVDDSGEEVETQTNINPDTKNLFDLMWNAQHDPSQIEG